MNLPTLASAIFDEFIHKAVSWTLRNLKHFSFIFIRILKRSRILRKETASFLEDVPCTVYGAVARSGGMNQSELDGRCALIRIISSSNFLINYQFASEGNAESDESAEMRFNCFYCEIPSFRCIQ